MAQHELLRIYTPQGLATDTFKPRCEVHRDGDWHATVHLWLLNPSSELLFQRRSDAAELHPGLWDVSAAGHIVDDDSPETSLEREALEELGVTIPAGAASYLFTLQKQWQSGLLHERVFQFIYLANCDVDPGDFKLQAEEVTGVAWHHYSVLRSLCRDPGGFVARTEEYARLHQHLVNCENAPPPAK